MTSKQLLNVLLRDKTIKRAEGIHVVKQFKVKNLKGHKVRRAPEKSRTAMATVPLPYLRHCARHAYRPSLKHVGGIIPSKVGTTKAQGLCYFSSAT